MPEFNAPAQRNTIIPKGEDAVESTDLLRASYVTGTDDITVLPDPHAFKGGLNGFEDEQALREAKAPRPRLTPPF